VAGVGKTSLASTLARKFKGVHVELGRLSVEEGLTLGYDKRRRCHIVDLERLSGFLAEKFSGVKGFLAFEAPFTVRLPEPLTPKAVFVLRCEPRQLAKRLKAKGYPPAKIMENLWAEILDYPLQEALAAYEAERIHELDVTARGVEEAAGEALEVLGGAKPPSYGRVNWLGRLEEEGLLAEISAIPARAALKRLLEG